MTALKVIVQWFDVTPAIVCYFAIVGSAPIVLDILRGTLFGPIQTASTLPSPCGGLRLAGFVPFPVCMQLMSEVFGV